MAAAMVNGFTPPTSDNTSEIQEYTKILKLRDEIFAGTHPRLTVPAHAIRKVSPLSAPTASLPAPFVTSVQQATLPGLSLNTGKDVQRDVDRNVKINPTSTVSKQTTTSGIDPVLLMKSDELVKAETHLHRQRLEKALRDQFEQKRLDARKRPAAGEAKPDFDVAILLHRAQEVVKPEGLANPKEDGSENGSADANSLYSSRAPDSTPEVGELEDSASSQNQNLSGGSFGANGPAETQARSAQHDRAAVPAPRIDSPPPSVLKVSGVTDLSRMDIDEEEEEGEYSPPEAVEQAANGDASSQTVVDPRTRTLRRYSELDEASRAPGSPGDHMRIVRNHILSPVAPQPSRVSPLAVTKDPLFVQNTRARNGRLGQRGRSPRQSPDNAGPNSNPRKKRRLDKRSDRRRRNGESPDVKDEPVSPPPFHDVQPLGSGKVRPIADDRPIIIDDGPVREIRYAQAPEPYISTPMRPISRQAELGMPLSEPRMISRNAMRPVRDETDLRRVASMHNMRVEQPREYVEQVPEGFVRARATSYVRVDSPMRMEPPRMVQEASHMYEREANQGVRVARSPAPVYREVYPNAEPEIRYIPEPMPPPVTERIVVDQYGRRFREIVQDRASVAPRAYPNYPEQRQASYYDGYDHGRGQSVIVESRQDPRMVPDMPPPQIMRQGPEPGLGYREIYEPMPQPRSGSVRPIEQPPRQPVYIDERSEYRPTVRVGSIRPSSMRYEEMAPPPPMQVRATSIRPGGREGSVFIDDRSQVRREYLPVDAPQSQYRVVEAQPQPRYIDASGREITYVGEGQDEGARYIQQRY